MSTFKQSSVEGNIKGTAAIKDFFPTAQVFESSNESSTYDATAIIDGKKYLLEYKHRGSKFSNQIFERKKANANALIMKQYNITGYLFVFTFNDGSYLIFDMTKVAKMPKVDLGRTTISLVNREVNKDQGVRVMAEILNPRHSASDGRCEYIYKECFYIDNSNAINIEK